MKINLPMFIGGIVFVWIGFGILFFHIPLLSAIVLIMNGAVFVLLVSILEMRLQEINEELEKKTDEQHTGV